MRATKNKVRAKQAELVEVERREMSGLVRVTAVCGCSASSVDRVDYMQRTKKMIRITSKLEVNPPIYSSSIADKERRFAFEAAIRSADVLLDFIDYIVRDEMAKRAPKPSKKKKLK